MMSPSLKVMTRAVAVAAVVALPLATACKGITPSTKAAGGGSHSAGGAGVNGVGKSPAKIAPLAKFSPEVKAGLTGQPILLDDKAEFSGSDIAVDASGRAYVGWISDVGGNGRKIHLCTLPPGATQCKGGIQSINPPAAGFGSSTSYGLRVLATPGGAVTLVWEHTTVASENGPQGDEIAIATSQRGGKLSAAKDVATAPSSGTMLDATLGPADSIWVAIAKSSTGGVQVRPGLNKPAIDLHPPFEVSIARLRFSQGTGALVVQKAGAITSPLAVASVHNGAFSGFTTISKTWTSDADLGLTATTSGIRLVTSVNNASYHPVDWTFSGGGFGQPTLTGDLGSCSPSSHDLTSDASGRAADASVECSDVAITNLPDTRHAAVTRFPVKGTFAGTEPQIATTPRGTGWVSWSIESSVADKLMVAPFVLPDGTASASDTLNGNDVTVSGPASCLTPVDVPVGITAKPAGDWHVVSQALRLGGTVLHSATLHGGSLTAGKNYALTGTVKFASASSHVTVTATLRFRSCPSS